MTQNKSTKSRNQLKTLLISTYNRGQSTLLNSTVKKAIKFTESGNILGAQKNKKPSKQTVHRAKCSCRPKIKLVIRFLPKTERHTGLVDKKSGLIKI